MFAVDNIDGSLEAEVVVAASLTSSSFPCDTNCSIQRTRNWKTCTERGDVACDRTSGISDRAVSKNDPFTVRPGWFRNNVLEKQFGESCTSMRRDRCATFTPIRSRIRAFARLQPAFASLILDALSALPGRTRPHPPTDLEEPPCGFPCTVASKAAWQLWFS